MEILTYICLTALGLLIICNLLLGLPYMRIALGKPGIIPDGVKLPKAAIILCMRGADPFLRQCIDSLLAQDYPDFTLHLVIDHPDDPANSVLSDQLLHTYASKLKIQYLEKPLDTCSLKCASQVQAIHALDPSVEIIAFADADIVPHPGWLTELAIPLLHDNTGASTGNRWYTPRTKSTFASYVRYVWNSVAIVSMHWLHIPWGGSMAVKRIVFDKTDILEHWQQALCEDTALNKYLEKLNLHLAFAPSLFIFNHENCTLTDFIRWETRQLLNNRLHHSLWNVIILHAFGMASILLANLIMLTVVWMNQDHRLFQFLLYGLVIYTITLFALLAYMETRMQGIARARNSLLPGHTLKNILRIISAIPVAHLLHPVIMLFAVLAKSVHWRGIDYRIIGPGRIRMESYKPYSQNQQQSSTENSI